ncbi:hypothetical protein VP01_2371g3 [Puccinia sorghi]|uniref:Uncharacterized protein n=1 Tax=Puccinia sorghi TaxID=27349 RepID=A0A0L6V704_9BASI|nr:hypothetical protein VP01_2371g3 [Puccinia sorghi]
MGSVVGCENSTFGVSRDSSIPASHGNSIIDSARIHISSTSLHRLRVDYSLFATSLISIKLLPCSQSLMFVTTAFQTKTSQTNMLESRLVPLCQTLFRFLCSSPGTPAVKDCKLDPVPLSSCFWLNPPQSISSKTCFKSSLHFVSSSPISLLHSIFYLAPPAHSAINSHQLRLSSAQLNLQLALTIISWISSRVLILLSTLISSDSPQLSSIFNWHSAAIHCHLGEKRKPISLSFISLSILAIVLTSISFDSALLSFSLSALLSLSCSHKYLFWFCLKFIFVDLSKQNSTKNYFNFLHYLHHQNKFLCQNSLWKPQGRNPHFHLTSHQHPYCLGVPLINLTPTHLLMRKKTPHFAMTLYHFC